MITSTSNSLVKRIRSLRADPRDRRSERMFVLEGVRLVADALVANADFVAIVYDPQALRRTAEGSTLLAQLESHQRGVPASPQVLDAAADTVSPQGVIAIAAWPEIEPRTGLRLVLDGVQDPGNVGTLLRSAEAAGVGLVLCSKGCADVFNPKVVRSAMGAHFALPIRIDLGWNEIATALANAPAIYAATANGQVAYYDADWHDNAALIVGSEAHGVSADGLTWATHQIAIPMVGRAESLNAGVAGSIILFEALRQRTRSSR